MTTLFNDNFTGAGALEDHTSDSGFSYVGQGGSAVLSGTGTLSEGSTTAYAPLDGTVMPAYVEIKFNINKTEMAGFHGCVASATLYGGEFGDTLGSMAFRVSVPT
jgi:hypothetical protein